MPKKLRFRWFTHILQYKNLFFFWLQNQIIQNQLVSDLLPLVESDVRGQRMSAYIGAQKLLDAYFNMLKR